MIVTIDGPAGAGKSSVARGLADRLGFDFLDTGAMYRAVTWAALEARVALEVPTQVADIARRTRIEFRGDEIFVNEKNVTREIRTPRVTESVHYVAGNEQVRSLLAGQQRRIGHSAKNIVTEGRDQGTIVFPEAECKIFLTATPEERAKRRYRELLAKGEHISFDEVLESQNERDKGDAKRDVAPLSKAEDAVEVYSDEMSLEQVLTHLEWIVRSK